MNERELLGQMERYHQELADRYRRLGEMLEGAPQAEEGKPLPNGVSSHAEPQKRTSYGNKARVPKDHRVVLPLRAKREAAGITLTALANRLGISASYVGQVESGAQKARPEVPQHWEAVLNGMIEEEAGVASHE